MDGLELHLYIAARRGETRGVRACLAAGADVNFRFSGGLVPLHVATGRGHTECVAALIAGGAEVDITNNGGEGPLHMAARQDRSGCVQQLLAAGADPLAVMPATGWTPLHYAAGAGNPDVVPLLLQAQPPAALARGALNYTPLLLAIRYAKRDTARCLLEQGPLPLAREVLAALANTLAVMQPLYATLVSRQPLAAEEWALLPIPCARLGAALPAVLRRSAAEAALLVRHLPADDRQRLRTAAMRLACAQRMARVSLPTPILWRILTQAAVPV